MAAFIPIRDASSASTSRLIKKVTKKNITMAMKVADKKRKGLKIFPKAVGSL